MNITLNQEDLMNLGVSEFLADKILAGVAAIDSDEPVDYWQQIVREVLDPYIPFEVHQLLFDEVARHWDEAEDGPMPAWAPSVARQQGSNLAAVMRRVELDDYDTFYRWSINERDAFWQTMIETLDIRFETPFTMVCDLSDGVTEPKWLPGARLNIVDSCFSAEPEAPAVVYRDREGAELERVSYGMLEARANRVANGLLALGFKPGDALAVDMVMNLESVVIYLGIVKAGCAVISIADSFTPPEIATRLRIGNAAGIFTMDHLSRGDKRLPMYEKVLEADPPKTIVVPHGETLSVSLREGDLSYADFLSDSEVFAAVAREPHDVVNILFSSGTTGDPKAIPWNHTTPIKAAVDGCLHHDIQPGDVVCWPTNLGWMMGPWLVFATLLNKGTIALYGEAPTSKGFCDFVADASVNMLGVVPSIVKAWRNGDAFEEQNWQAIRAFSSTGECSSPGDMLYLMSRAGYQPVIEYCGGTEIGGAYATGTVVQPAVPSTFSTPALGTELIILDEDNHESDAGEVYLVPPTMGLSVTLLNKNHHEQYFQDTPLGPEGKCLRRHGDQLQRLPNGYLRAHGRADDTMNLGGIKVGSAEIERVLKGVAGTDETAAIAVPPPDGGPSRLVIFATLLSGDHADELRATLQKAIRAKLNPLFKIHEVMVVDSLPRTASGKVMRRLLRKQFGERSGG